MVTAAGCQQFLGLVVDGSDIVVLGCDGSAESGRAHLAADTIAFEESVYLLSQELGVAEVDNRRDNLMAERHGRADDIGIG